MSVTYKITPNLPDDGGYAILRVDGKIITWVQLNIRTHTKAIRAKRIWEEREAAKHE